MLNYTYETVQLTTGDQPGERLYLGHSRDIAETRAVLSCERGRFTSDYGVYRVETQERVSVVRGAALAAYAASIGLK